KQTWPSSSNPDGMVLNIPANYIDGSTFIFEPILKEEEEKKRKVRVEEEKEEICDVYTCQELFEILLPKFEPKNLENLHIFQTISSKDLDVYQTNYLRVKLESWYSVPIKIANPNFSIPKNLMHLDLAQDFHTKKNFWNSELFEYIQIKLNQELDLIEVISLNKDVPGGFYEVVPYKDLAKKYNDNVVEDAHHHKIFFSQDQYKKITTYIECDSESSYSETEKVKLYISPNRYHCKHNFDIPELSLNITASYSGKYLPQWKYIELKIKQLIKSFQEK
ncbi:hypothetical protein OHW23_17520, partial [Acinetobacter baumannii]|nr:hypothetical protein [Acinetobacter baumannii]